MATKKAATKKVATKKAAASRPAEWPAAAVGSDALESLRDGNPPHALMAFARNAIGAGNHAWAMQYLRRGVEYLRYVMTSFPEVADRVQVQHDQLVRLLVDTAVATGDESTLEFSLPTPAKPEQFAGKAEHLMEAKRYQMAVDWFVRARNVPMTDAERAAYLSRFGTAELVARKRAKCVDVALAAELVKFAREALQQLNPRDASSAMQKRVLQQLQRTAQKALAAEDAPAKPTPSS